MSRVLILDPGVLAPMPLVDGGLETWRVRCDAVLAAARRDILAARDGLAGQGGAIAVVIPAEAEEGGEGLTAYLAAAEGVAALVKSLAGAWAPEGIRINCLSVEAAMLHDDPARLEAALAPFEALLASGAVVSGTTLKVAS